MHEKINTGLFVAGAFGSAFGVWLNRNNLPKLVERVCAFGWGLAGSYYLTPWVMYGLGTSNNERAYAFLVGTFGMTIATAVWRLVAQSDWFGLVRDALYAKLGIVKKMEGEQ